METRTATTLPLFPELDFDALTLAQSYPRFRLMGSKHRLLPWLHSVLRELSFDTVLDAFTGSGCVAYLLKAMGKQVTANDFMLFPTTIAQALVENPGHTLPLLSAKKLARYDPRHRHFIERTFNGIFFEPADLRFLDRVWWNLRTMEDGPRRQLALAALIRACIKRQPRGVFTVAGDPAHHKDGRRDLRISIEEHFFEQVACLNKVVFDSGALCRTTHSDIFNISGHFDLVYLDPPYVPRSDDNCYIKRYHFLEGLACYWDGQTILEESKVKKLEKRYTPFSYKRDSLDAFARLFWKFRRSSIVLSYSSNGYPDLDTLVDLLRRHKKDISIFKKHHRYHFGTHRNVQRSRSDEYLIVAQ